MPTLETALEIAAALPREEQHELEAFLRERRIADRREELAATGHEAIRAFRAGELKSETVEELIQRLTATLDADTDDEEAE